MRRAGVAARRPPAVAARLLSGAAPKAAPAQQGAGGYGLGREASAAIAAFGLVTLLAAGRGGAAGAPAAHAEAAAPAPAAAPAEAAPAPVVHEHVTIKLGVPDDKIDALEARLRSVEGALWGLEASGKNQAFVFIKPHAVNAAVEKLVAERLAKAGIRVKAEGEIAHNVIDDKGLIDTHYGAIAQKAAQLSAAEQNVSPAGQEAFKKQFGEDWSEVVKAGRVLNAKEACKKWGINGAQMDARWGKLNKKTDMLKFGGGHYVGKLEDPTAPTQPLYVINGFFMAMRSKFTEAPAKIHYYVVEWDPSQLAWGDFRGKVLGGTDPASAAPGSLRRVIFDQWKELGLAAQPDTGDNGVHASASPFEGCAERVNWTGADLEKDTFGKAALGLGIPKDKLKLWMGDAQVKVDGKKQSIFDYLEDQNSKENLEHLAKVLAQDK